MSSDEILNLDLYEIIGVCREATVSEVSFFEARTLVDS